MTLATEQSELEINLKYAEYFFKSIQHEVEQRDFQGSVLRLELQPTFHS